MLAWLQPGGFPITVLYIYIYIYVHTIFAPTKMQEISFPHSFGFVQFSCGSIYHKSCLLRELGTAAPPRVDTDRRSYEGMRRKTDHKEDLLFAFKHREEEMVNRNHMMKFDFLKTFCDFGENILNFQPNLNFNFFI